MASISCPHCAQTLDLPDSAAGKAVVCPQCQQTFRTPESSAVASGAPRVGAASDEAVTDKPPSAKPQTEPDSSDSLPRIRRDRASGGTSTAVIAIIILGSVAVLGLCVCAPVVLFLGVIPFRMQAQQVEAVVQQEGGAEVQVEDAERKLIGFAKGAADAKDAIAKDKLLLKEYPPLPAPGWHGDYIKLLKEKCKCDYQVIGDPNLAKDQQDEIRGWNEATQAELRRRHGEAILADLNQEAEKLWRDRIKAQENKK